ncbi:CHAD domain-containing protein [Spirulina subsalsa FACHB-351]|uniref:CHAD domain-containing protein n=1 Tax=Spirulina subsalsa FACHB-351 TaxID=234711 RepID=A0ABT3L080_9CYAN|nr:CHAD domain-containing protein [Spirulina subsalsa]MCW6034891.1 CHAD domain-containing protein [Spirulina subsalsa FACHB-351]
MKQPTPETAVTFGDWAYIAVAKHYKKILKHEPEVLKDQDPEELHQMRVGMRRLRTVLIGFATALRLPKGIREQKVGKFARILGELRDLDVLGESLKKDYLPHLPKKEQKVLRDVFPAFKHQRHKAFKQVRKALQEKPYLKFKQRLTEWLEFPQYHAIASLPIEEVLADLLLPQVSQLLLHQGWWVGVGSLTNAVSLDPSPRALMEQVFTHEITSLHSLRKEAKRSRYQLELFTQFYGETYQSYVQDIKEIQTVLGDIQDSFVLVEFLQSLFPDPIEQELPHLTQKLQEIRWEKWQAWQGLQAQFTEPSTRHHFRLTVQKLEPLKQQSFPKDLVLLPES